MTDYLVTDTELTSVANAIRTKGGTSAQLNFPTEFVSAIGDISSGGLSRAIVGTFITPEQETLGDVAVQYEGNGYPIAFMIFVADGAYNPNSAAYDVVDRYSIVQMTMSKSIQDTAPSYDGSGSDDYGVTTTIYKSGSSAGTSYTRNSAMNTLFFKQTLSTNATNGCVCFNSATVFRYTSGTTTFSLLPNTEYTYIVIYST